ncbi:MAG: glycoside hydrolase family 31 protein [Paludibacter sp.]
MKKLILNACLLLTLTMQAQNKTIEITLEKGEKVWSGIVNEGCNMPYNTMKSYDLYGDNFGNQVQPLLLTNKGQYVWSEDPFKFQIVDGKIIISNLVGKIKTGKSGNTLQEAREYVSQTYFPASGKTPDKLLFSAPQYNTWIELQYNQNQEDILKYARNIISNGLPAGVLMIDDTWQEAYGVWNFHPGRFSNPKAMIDELHAMGFKVMLWICPFVSPDQYQICKEISKNRGFLMQKNGTGTYKTAKEPALINWWNGYSHVLDFTNPEAVKWFDGQLNRLVNYYGVDGFKFDAGDFKYYPVDENAVSMRDVTPNEHARLFAEFGLKYPLNEYRACWKMAGQPLAQRLRDKKHNWEDLRSLVPNMLIENLVGYTFSCPDLIGGGDFISFFDGAKIDQDLIVRSAQCHALMPMMQFSAAPWRVLDSVHFAAVKKTVNLRMKLTPEILKLADNSAKTGEPIMYSLELLYPNQGFERISNQFLLGKDLIVAPMLKKGETTRSVILPKGKWLADDGKIYKGGKTYQIDVPLDRLPYFKLTK